MRALLVPGFAQTGSVWDQTIIHLRVEATALEIPPDLDFLDTAQALGTAGGAGVYAGYSMGGRLALALALEQPELVQHLILVSSGPGIEDRRQRQARAAADEELARWTASHSREEFIDRWAQQAIFTKRLPRNHRHHRLSSPNDIAGQLRRLGQGTQPSLWGRLDELRMPVTFLVGAMDEKYRRIADRAIGLIGGSANIITVAGSDHAVVYHEPIAVARVINEAVAAVAQT